MGSQTSEVTQYLVTTSEDYSSSSSRYSTAAFGRHSTHLGDQLKLGDGHLLAQVPQDSLQARLLGSGIAARLAAQRSHGEVVVR